MSRKMLWGGTILPGCLVLAAVWTILTLPGSALADPPPHNHGGGEAGQNIAVCIMFDDAPGDGVLSDDGAAYCDGDSNGRVTAIVSRNFNIVLGGNNSHKKRAGRTFFLDLSVDLTCNGSVKVDVNRPSASGPFGDGICDPCSDTVPDFPNVRFGTPIQDQKFGFPDNAEFVILGRDLDDVLVIANPPLVGPTFATIGLLIFSVDGETWELHWVPFRNPGGGTFCPESDPVIVTRTTNDTWTFESTGGHLACLYRAPKNSDPEYRGQFFVPFFATAVAIEPDLVGTPDGSTELNVPGDGDPGCE